MWVSGAHQVLQVCVFTLLSLLAHSLQAHGPPSDFWKHIVTPWGCCAHCSPLLLGCCPYCSPQPCFFPLPQACPQVSCCESDLSSNDTACLLALLLSLGCRRALLSISGGDHPPSLVLPHLPCLVLQVCSLLRLEHNLVVYEIHPWEPQINNEKSDKHSCKFMIFCWAASLASFGHQLAKSPGKHTQHNERPQKRVWCTFLEFEAMASARLGDNETEWACATALKHRK